MLIRTGWNVPVEFEEHFEILILHREKRVMVPVRLERISVTDKFRDVISLEVLNPPKEYLEMARLRGPVYKMYSSIARKLLRQ